MIVRRAPGLLELLQSEVVISDQRWLSYFIDGDRGGDFDLDLFGGILGSKLMQFWILFWRIKIRIEGRSSLVQTFYCFIEILNEGV